MARRKAAVQPKYQPTEREQAAIAAIAEKRARAPAVKLEKLGAGSYRFTANHQSQAYGQALLMQALGTDDTKSAGMEPGYHRDASVTSPTGPDSTIQAVLRSSDLR